MTRLVAVGDLMVDVLVTGRGHDAAATLRPGGAAANVSAWAVAAGATATAVGWVGDDHAGRWLRTLLAERGVGSEIGVLPGHPTGVFVLLDDGIRAAPGANRAFTPELLRGPVDADAVFVSGYLPAPTVFAVADRARARFVAVAAGCLEALPPAANVVLANEREATALTGLGPGDAARALAAGRALACVTTGARGVVACTGGALLTAGPLRVVDSAALGAGDAFAAGLLVALAEGAAAPAALTAACELAARAAEAPDGWPAAAT